MTLKVLVVNESLTMGGAQSASVELANALAENDDVAIHFLAADGPLQERINSTICRWDAPRFGYFSLVHIFFRYIKVLAQIKPDIVHVHSGTLLGVCWVAAITSFSKASFIFTHHSQMFTRLPAWTSTWLINCACHKVIAISGAKQRQLIRFGIRKEKVELIPNFIDIGLTAEKLRNVDVEHTKLSLGIEKNTLVITMIGRLVPGKNHVQFISLVKLYAQMQKVKVAGIIVGDGELREALEKYASEDSGDASFIFTGYTNDIYTYLAVTDIFLFPSEYEILPVVLLEAAASHLPIVCSDIPGNDDVVIDGVSGYLIKGTNEKYLAALCNLGTSPELRKKMGEAGYRIVNEKFDRQPIVKRYVQLYNDSLRKK